MIRFRLERLWDGWIAVGNLRMVRLLRGLLALLLRLLGRLVRALWWQLRLAWARMSGRARVAATLIGLVMLSAQTASFAPSLSATAYGLAVLLVAGVGFWMIVTAPFARRRRWR